MNKYTAVCVGVFVAAGIASARTSANAAKGSQQAGQRSQARVYPLSGPLTVIKATPGNPVNAIAFSPDGALLAVGSYDGSIRLWSVRARVLIRKMDAGKSEVHSVAFSPDGKLVASGNHEGNVILWSTVSGLP